MIKLNFFKSGDIQKKKRSKKTPASARIVAFILILISAYMLYTPQQTALTDHKLQVGDIVKEDIIIKTDMTIEDKESTENKRKQAVENVIPIYEFKVENQQKVASLFGEWYKALSAFADKIDNKSQVLSDIKSEIETNFGINLTTSEIKYLKASDLFGKIKLDALLRFIDNLNKQKIIQTKIGLIKSRENTIRVVAGGEEPSVFKLDQIRDLKEIENNIITWLRNQKISTREVRLSSKIIQEIIKQNVNLTYSLTLTKEEEQRISSQVNPVLIKLKTGKIILRKGDEITPADMKIIGLIAKEEQIREKGLSKFFLILGLLIFLFLFIEKFFKIWKSDSINKDKLFLVTSATLTVSAIVYRISVFLYPLILKNISLDISIESSSFYFALPFGFGALIIAFIFNLQSAVIFSFMNAIIGAVICEWDLTIALYVLVGNLAASYGIEYFQRLKRSPIFKASLFWLFPINAAFILLFNLAEPNLQLMSIVINLVMGLISAIIAPILVSFIVPLWEVIFNLITELKLIELANLNLPIFREMLEKAPGTYHHSQMVASLSETAAVDLEISPLLLTCKALYHDIGKINNPQFFTENQSIYKNPHENLSPRESAKNIIAHIEDGLEKAAKIKLPPQIKSAISQHHGTKVVRFFYDKAREMSSVDTDEFEDKVFHYQGERPKNIENAIIMLADHVEAASKSLATPTDEEIQNIIQQIISSNIDENQFDDCLGLTFKALNTIANSFHKKLSSIYHMRVSYPGFNFKDKKEIESNGNNNH